MTQQHRVTIERMEDIPSFASEAEERAFWDTHDLAGHLFERADLDDEIRELLPPRRAHPQRMALTIDLDVGLIADIRAYAATRALAEETVIETFLREALRAHLRAS